MKYDLNIPKLIEVLLPPLLRGVNRIKLLASLTISLDYLYNGKFDSDGNLIEAGFIQYKKEIEFKTKYNCQQGVLAHLLNELFDPIHERIRIQTTSDIVPSTYMRQSGEAVTDLTYMRVAGETTIEKAYMRRVGEIGDSYRFIVYVPTALTNKETEIKAWVDYYRFASKKYKIQYK